GPHEQSAIRLLAAAQAMPNISPKEKAEFIAAQHAVRLVKFQDLPRKLNALQKAVTKKPVTTAAYLDKLLEIVRTYPLNAGNDEVSAHAVFAFFAQDGNAPYRLTYAAKESKLGADLKVQTEQTAPRRFTYILGPGESCRTPAERLTTLARKQLAVTLADATDA